MDLEELSELADEKIKLGNDLITSLATLEQIDGVKKIQRKITQEVKFVEKVRKNGTLQKNHIQCSNLTHFKSLVRALRQFQGLRNVDYAVPISNSDKTIRVDIVAEDGAIWIKVVARNPKSIKATVEGMASFGAKSILDQAEEILEAARLNPHLYQPPRVIFLFLNPIDAELAETLQAIGVEVQNFDAVKSSERVGSIDTLNLDVTTLIAYVSSLTNGRSHCTFSDTILNEQAQMEQKKPIKPLFDALFQEKQLICCETAVRAFKDIVHLLGGVGEKARAEEFLLRIQVLPDVNVENLIGVNVTGQVKERSLKIFSFGIFHKALNVTANEGFCRSMKMQGMDIPVYLHEARALTELKEKLED